MLWFGKQAKQGRDTIVPATLEVEFDLDIFKAIFSLLLGNIREKGELETFTQALETKHQLFAKVLAKETLPSIAKDEINYLLETIFPIRRRLSHIVDTLGIEVLRQALIQLLYGDAGLSERLNNFLTLFPQPDKKDKEGLKRQRALWDMAAEVLHFYAPEQYPLMSRWIWDIQTQSGALREFIQNNDALPKIPLDNTPEVFEAGRIWIAERLNEEGFYRDVPYMVDLILAQAYANYSRAMSMTLGMIQAEFGAKADPLEMQVKLLGIDEDRLSGKSRLKDSDSTLH